MYGRIKITTILILFMTLSGILWANTFVYETVTGSLSGLQLNEDYSYDNPEAYEYTIPYYADDEYWDTDGFLGRFIYQGTPNTLTVETHHPGPTTYNDGRFYYFYVNSTGMNDYDTWKEYFLLFRIKGRFHNGGTYDLDGQNIVIEYPGTEVDIPVGAGTERVSAGEWGYNESGDYDLYDGVNGYEYLYRFSHLWVDVTVIRTVNERDLKKNKGYYSSSLHITGDGIDNSIWFEGEVSAKWFHMDPDSYSFGIERIAPETIPFTDLIDSFWSSYRVGYLSYNSEDVPGYVSFSADLGGQSTDFFFSPIADEVDAQIPYYVIFDPVISGDTEGPTIVGTTFGTKNEFSTDYREITSPIGGANNYQYAVTGYIDIMLNSEYSSMSFPAATYSSTIYAFFTAY